MASSLFSLYSICTNLGKPFAIIANTTCAAHMKTKFCRPPFSYVRHASAHLFPFVVRGCARRSLWCMPPVPRKGRCLFAKEFGFYDPCTRLWERTTYMCRFIGFQRSRTKRHWMVLRVGEDMYWNLFARSKEAEDQTNFSQSKLPA